MNLLIFSPYPPTPGGGSNATYEIFKRFPNNDILHIITYQNSDKKSDNVSLYHINLKGNTTTLKGIIYILFAIIGGTFVGISKNIDVIYAKNLVSPGMSALFTSFILRKPLVLHTSGPDVQDLDILSKSYRVFGQFYRRIIPIFVNVELDHAKYIIANCKTDEIAIKKVRPFITKIKVIYNGVDTTKFHPDTCIREKIRKKLGFGKQITVAFSGRAAEEKNPKILLRVADKLNDHKFLFIGPEKNELGKFGEIPPNCVCTGMVEDVSEYLQASDIFLLPSRAEGLSNALLEAMACGLPPVIYPAGDAPYIIEQGKNGYLATNEEEIIRYLRLLSKEKKIRDEIGANARNTIISNFTWNKTATEIRELLKEMNK